MSDPETLTELPRPPRVPSGVELPRETEEPPQSAKTEPAQSFEERILVALDFMTCELAGLRSDVQAARAATERVEAKADAIANNVEEAVAILRSEDRSRFVSGANAMTNLEHGIEQLRDSATKDVGAVRKDVHEIRDVVEDLRVRVRNLEDTQTPPPLPMAAE